MNLDRMALCGAALLYALCTPTLAASAASARDALTTISERSGWKKTGRFEEVERLCPAFEQQWPKQVRCIEFGRSPEQRPMLALIASADGVLDAETAHKERRPVVLMQGGIHAGEIDGKDAGFLALREMLQGKAAPGALERVTFVFVPVLSVDAHERFGPWNRPNQNGPEEMGWRVNSQNLNLNRDYVKAEATEMRALLGLLNEWDPILYVDLHATDGAQFEHDISYTVTPTLGGGDAELMREGAALRDELMQRAAKHGSLPIDFYPSFVREDDPMSGFAVDVGPKRFSTEYWAARNRLAVLVETHSWKDYPTRVRITRNSIIDMIEMAANHGQRWLEVARGADDRAMRIGGSQVALTYENTDHVQTIEFRGYEYTREPSAISGALLTRYNPKRPQIWHVPLKDEVKPALTVTAPRGGYIVPAGFADVVAEKLRLHGIEFHRLSSSPGTLDAETFRATKASLAPQTFEGRPQVTIEGEWKPERREVPAGSLLVPIAQHKSRLVLTLLEPGDPDSLVSWGYFNAAFERKEYMEAYVAEEVAIEMLKKDPALAREFNRRLSEDAEFARDPAARLDFFYRRHPSWDERYNLYPVLRVQQEMRPSQ